MRRFQQAGHVAAPFDIAQDSKRTPLLCPSHPPCWHTAWGRVWCGVTRVYNTCNEVMLCAVRYLIRSLGFVVLSLVGGCPMRTVLDEAEMWLLQAIVYRGDLRLYLAEMLLGEAGSKIPDNTLPKVKEILQDARPLEVRDESRLMVIRFPDAVAWQVVDENYTGTDDCESDDHGVLSTLTRSKYLDYVHDVHGWFRDIVGPAKHYRIWTGDEVIDVVSCSEPAIEPWESDT